MEGNRCLESDTVIYNIFINVLSKNGENNLVEKAQRLSDKMIQL